MKTRQSISTTLMLLLGASLALAQNPEVELHVNPRWKECSFQLDPSLTQDQFHRFTREAGMVACFRPLANARSMGAGQFEFSLLQYKTGIDETNGAWNNTFVHPDDEHYLVGGKILTIPGISVRAGITDKLDAGAFWTMSPGANYGFFGGQLQYQFMESAKSAIDLSSRLGFNKLYGPKDIGFTVYNYDLVVGRNFHLLHDWLILSPYAGASVYYTRAKEKSDLVNLETENVAGLQAMTGVVAKVRHFSLAAEYNWSAVNTFSFRLGYGFGRLARVK